MYLGFRPGWPMRVPLAPAGTRARCPAGTDAEGGVREQDRFPSIANISRMMKAALPANAKIVKDAKETIQECASEFTIFTTSDGAIRASDNGYDLLWAMATLGFEGYMEPLKVYLQKYRESCSAAFGVKALRMAVWLCCRAIIIFLLRVATGCQERSSMKPTDHKHTCGIQVS